MTCRASDAQPRPWQEAPLPRMPPPPAQAYAHGAAQSRFACGVGYFQCSERSSMCKDEVETWEPMDTTAGACMCNVHAYMHINISFWQSVFNTAHQCIDMSARMPIHMPIHMPCLYTLCHTSLCTCLVKRTAAPSVVLER